MLEPGVRRSHQIHPEMMSQENDMVEISTTEDSYYQERSVILSGA